MPIRLLVASLLLLVLSVSLGRSAPSAEAAFPGVNGLLAYVGTHVNPETIYIDNAEGTNEQPFPVPGNVSAYAPAWSADGNSLAYVRTDDDSVWVADADGGDQMMVAQGNNPTWTPDGNHVVFDRDGEIFIVARNGTGEDQIGDTSGLDAFQPAVSPDGELVAFAGEARVGPPFEIDIWIMEIDGGNLHQLSNPGDFDDAPNWSPDGERIVYASWDGTQEDIWVMNADGTGRTNLTTTPNRVESNPAWSPDGQKIAFLRERLETDPQAAPQGVPPADIYTMTAEGDDLYNVTQGTGSDTFDQPNWQSVEADYLWGDADCSGEVTPEDARLVLLDSLDSIATSVQGTDCVALGTVVDTGSTVEEWGNFACQDGRIGALDALAILQWYADLEYEHAVDCPIIGDPVMLEVLQ